MPGLNANTAILLHLNGPDTGTTFTDASANGHVPVAQGNAQLDTAQSKFGSASLLLDNTGDYLLIPSHSSFDFSGDLTIDAWVRLAAIGENMICARVTSGTSYFYFGFENNDLRFRDYNNSFATDIDFSRTTSLSINTWYHIAVTKSGNDYRMFVDGVQQGATHTETNAFINRSGVDFEIGSMSQAGSYYMNGWIDEFRIQNGEAAWTANFTPESGEYSPPTLESVEPDDSMELSDSWALTTNPEQAAINDAIELADSWSALVNPESQILSGTIKMSDTFSPRRSFREFINTELNWSKLFSDSIQTFLAWIKAEYINTQLNWQGKNDDHVNCDLRWLPQPYAQVAFDPINQLDIQIIVNGTDILAGNDIDLQTGNITHNVGARSVASFVLARRHDDINRTHLGVASTITTQNPVQIIINGNLEFDGLISTVTVQSDNELVAVQALMEQPADRRHTVHLPLPSLNEKLHPYHCLTNNVQIDNPIVDIRAVIVGANGRYWTGSAWTFFIENALIFATDPAAQSYIDAYVDVSVDQLFRSQNPSVASRDKNPQYYKGIKVNLGIKTVQKVDRWRDYEVIEQGKGKFAKAIENGTFTPKQNYSYFWNVLPKNIRLGLDAGTYRYIGTSLGSITTDLWVLRGVQPLRQRISPDIETPLGWYYVGQAPYREISPKAGQLIPAERWEDRDDGLYNVTDASYNYIPYVKLMADRTYAQMLNVSGGIIPLTAATIEVTFDAYYYYRIKLLTRVNVTNTVVTSYNNDNGFPTSVKGISINFRTMKITLTTDNRLSQQEIDEIESTKPDSSLYETVPRASLVFRKFDLKSYMFVS